jgi:hypothetical protein
VGGHGSPGRTTALIVIGALALVAVVVVVLVTGIIGGGKSNSTTTAGSPPVQTSGSAGGSSARRSASSGARAGNPAVTRVSVLNGTSTVGLARRLSDALQQKGYRRANFLTASPTGTHSSTLVEYAAGHRADALAVARALGVSRSSTSVKPLDAATGALGGSGAVVVVIAGSDQTRGRPGSAGGSGSSTGGAGGSGAGTGASGAGAGAPGQ